MVLPDGSTHEDVEYPLLMAPGRILHDDNQAMEVCMDGKRNVIQRDQVVELHTSDASALGVVDGDAVEVVWEQDRVRGLVRLSGPHKGLVSTTSLFGSLATKLDQSELPDPILKVPRLTLVPVRVLPVSEAVAD